MSTPYAVLDTCVLLPSPIYSTLLYMAQIALFSPIWSNHRGQADLTGPLE